jgi:very-short-patch-repair endonuclease/general stress protein YciG
MTVSLKAMTPEERREWYREIGRKGGRARAQMPDFPEHQRRAGRRSAEVNNMAALGRKGARAYIRRYGYGKLFRLARAWRLENPSRHEQTVMAMLDEMGLRYEREAEVLGEDTFVSVDFHLPGLGRIIEVNGRVHYDPMFDHPRYPETRRAKEEERLRRLLKASFEVLVIDHRDLEADEEAIRQQLVEFVRATESRSIPMGREDEL